MRVLRALLIMALAAYGTAATYMYLQQRSFLYHPANKGLTPESVGISGAAVEEITAPDGVKLVAWYAAAQAGKATILYLHGNAGEIGDRPDRFRFYQAAGYGVLFLSYRGFGGSEGEISEAGLVTDAIAAFDWLQAAGVPASRIVAVGESLGSGVAVQLAASRKLAALALEAPYTATVDIAADIYWWLPVRLLMKDQFLSRDHIANVEAPLLIQHGEADTLIPVAHGKALFALAREPKSLAIIPGGGHDIIHEPVVWARELTFFDQHIQ